MLFGWQVGLSLLEGQWRVAELLAFVHFCWVGLLYEGAPGSLSDTGEERMI